MAQTTYFERSNPDLMLSSSEITAIFLEATTAPESGDPLATALVHSYPDDDQPMAEWEGVKQLFGLQRSDGASGGDTGLQRPEAAKMKLEEVLYSTGAELDGNQVRETNRGSLMLSMASIAAQRDEAALREVARLLEGGQGYNGWTGSPFFSNTHAWRDSPTSAGKTTSNILTVTVADPLNPTLDELATIADQALECLGSFRLDNGTLPNSDSLATFLTPSIPLRRKLRKTFGVELVEGGKSNTLQIDDELKAAVFPYLTDPTSFYAFNPMAKIKPFHMYNIEKLVLDVFDKDTEYYRLNQKYLFKARQKLAIGPLFHGSIVKIKMVPAVPA